MRSKIVQKLIDETPKEINDRVDRYAEILTKKLNEQVLLDLGFEVKMASVGHNFSFVKDGIIIRNSLRSGFFINMIKINTVGDLLKELRKKGKNKEADVLNEVLWFKNQCDD